MMFLTLVLIPNSCGLLFLNFLFRICVYKSFSRGSKMERVFSGIPAAKSRKETSKRVYLYLKTDIWYSIIQHKDSCHGHFCLQ